MAVIVFLPYYVKYKTYDNKLNYVEINFFFQSLTTPGLDENLTIMRYERTHEQNEELGLNDIKVHNYE